jgi:hypothetical protein
MGMPVSGSSGFTPSSGLQGTLHAESRKFTWLRRSSLAALERLNPLEVRYESKLACVTLRS